MSDLQIILTETLREDYRRLPDHIKRKFDKQLRFLAHDPKHPSLQIHRQPTIGNFTWTSIIVVFFGKKEMSTSSSTSADMK